MRHRSGAILVNLKARLILQLILFLKHVLLLGVEQRPEATGCKCPQGTKRRLARAGSVGGRHCAFDVRLDRWMASSKRALLPRFGPTHRAPNRQYPLQRKLTGFHSCSIQHRRLERWSILLSSSSHMKKVLGRKFEQALPQSLFTSNARRCLMTVCSKLHNIEMVFIAHRQLLLGKIPVLLCP